MKSNAPVTRSDSLIQQDVLDELDWDTHIRPNEIGVSVKDGIVTLTGQVDSYSKRWAAQEAALRVLGVKAVANDLDVYLHSTAERTDTELARAAIEALTWDAEIPAQAVHVSVMNGWVTLTGQVEVYFQREAAERAIHHLAGVRGVTNALTVRQTGPAPADVKQRIERALVRNAETDAARITVEVHGHEAVLTGTVRSYTEKRAAEASARSAPGIVEVKNHLVVEV
ncbi:MAG TPA: BON domain-containing protein [Ktedonobacterales bacterium]|nr:BON domain-containing protein [Ktedonobacterales bacterium]